MPARLRLRWIALTAIVALPALTMMACGRAAPTSPVEAPYDLASNPLPVLHSAAFAASPSPWARALAWGTVASPSDSDSTVTGCDSLVVPGVEQEVHGGRYHIRVHAGSASRSMRLQCKYWDDGWLEFKLLPEGEVFQQPLDLTIDCAGTNADSSSANFDGAVPRFFWYDPKAEHWVPMPGTFDPFTRRFHAQVSHFSRYAVGGKAGW